MTEAVITSFGAAVAGVITALAGAWVYIEKFKREWTVKQTEAMERSEQKASNEYRELFRMAQRTSIQKEQRILELVHEHNVTEDKLQRRIRRLEKALLKAGIAFPDDDDDDDDTGEHRKL